MPTSNSFLERLRLMNLFNPPPSSTGISSSNMNLFGPIPPSTGISSNFMPIPPWDNYSSAALPPGSEGGLPIGAAGGLKEGPGMLPSMIQQNAMPDQNDMTGQDEMTGRLKGYEPRHELSDALVKALQGMPERPVPGKLRRIGAMLSGMGAGASAQDVVGGQPIGFKYDPKAQDLAENSAKYGDYENKKSDWMDKIRSLGIGATEEDKSNTNARLAAYGAEAQYVARERAASYQQHMANEQQKFENAAQHQKDLAEKYQADAISKDKLIEATAKWHSEATAALKAINELKVAEDKRDSEAKAQETKREFDEKYKQLGNLQKAQIGLMNSRSDALKNPVSKPIVPKTTYSYDNEGKLIQTIKSGPTIDEVPMYSADGKKTFMVDRKLANDYAKEYGWLFTKPVKEQK